MVARRRWLGLTVLGFGVALVVVDITIVNVAMPAIIADLDLDFSDAAWVNAVYAVVFATFLITLGRVGDLLGRRRLFLAGLVIFLAASLSAAGSDSLRGLVASRAFQGLGAAMILPATLAIVKRHLPWARAGHCIRNLGGLSSGGWLPWVRCSGGG